MENGAMLRVVDIDVAPRFWARLNEAFRHLGLKSEGRKRFFISGICWANSTSPGDEGATAEIVLC